MFALKVSYLLILAIYFQNSERAREEPDERADRTDAKLCLISRIRSTVEPRTA